MIWSFIFVIFQPVIFAFQIFNAHFCQWKKNCNHIPCLFIVASEGLYLTVSIVELKFDSITIRVEVNECFIPAIINVTIVVLGKTLERPEIYIITDQELVQIIKNLESDTMYNVTVTVFYIENGKELQLTPETLSFTTPQDFSGK